MSDFFAKLRRGGFPVSLEITPPRNPRTDVLLRRARSLGSDIDSVGVTQRRGRVSSLDAAIELLKAGIEPCWHLVSRGRSRDQIASDIAMAAQMDVSLVLCVRGDLPDQKLSDTPRIREVISMVREGMPRALIGATMNQYGPRDRVLRNLLPKLEAGAALVQTQPVFDLELFASLAKETLEASPGTRIMPLVVLLRSADEARSLQKRLNVVLPDRTLERLDQGGESAGWEIFEETLAGLSRCGVAHAVAVMTMLTEPPEPIAAGMAAALREHT